MNHHSGHPRRAATAFWLLACMLVALVIPPALAWSPLPATAPMVEVVGGTTLVSDGLPGDGRCVEPRHHSPRSLADRETGGGPRLGGASSHPGAEAASLHLSTAPAPGRACAPPRAASVAVRLAWLGALRC